MNRQTTSSSSAPSGSPDTVSESTPAAAGTFTQTAADLMRELHQLQAVVQSSSVLDFEAELNAALGKETSPASTNGHGPSTYKRSTNANGRNQEGDDDDVYEVVDDDGDAALASLNSDLETATRLLGLLDGKCDAMNARLDALLALMEEANDLGLDLDESATVGAEPTVTVTSTDQAAATGAAPGLAEQELPNQEQATPPSD